MSDEAKTKPPIRTIAVVLVMLVVEGAAIVGIFHDAAAREAVCDREIDVSAFAPGLAA